jgi:cell wall-associated NlpC family hydrolase
VYVKVSVATLWVSPDSPRAVDAPALAAPVHIRAWLGAMSTAVRRDLVGRVETQALLGERLVITGSWPGWLHVVAPGQPTHRDPRGYPGWVPRRQVTAHSPTASSTVATVVRLTPRLRRPDGTRAFEVSYGTRLPVLDTSTTTVTVATPRGRARTLPAAAVVVAAPAAAALPRTRRSVVDSAFGFRGVPYLWGGRSGFAVDCSGFTDLVYGVHGVTLPRDADDQSQRGRAVDPGSSRRADLAFFAPSGSVSHVGFVVGSGRLLHAPSTGHVVSVTRLSSMSGLAGIRRYL